MVTDRDEIHVETDAARGGSTPHIVRWVLAISLLAAIVLLSIIWITGAASQREGEGNVEVRERVLQEYGSRGGVLPGEGDDTDSIVGEDADRIDEAPAPGDTDPAPLPTVEN